MRNLKKGDTLFPPPPSKFEPKVRAEVPVRCKVCHDVGVLHPVENGKPNYAVVIPCRACVSPDRIKHFLGVSSLDSTFDNFKPNKGSEDALKASKAIMSLSTEWKLLLVYGTWGNGKTHLLEAISLDLWQRGYTVQVLTFPEFIGNLKNTFDNKEASPTFDEQIKSLSTRPYLLLDDVGSAGSFTPWSLSQLERVILARYRDNLFTVITTNLNYEQIPNFIISRFSDAEKGRIVLNGAKDYRPLKVSPKGQVLP